MKIAILSLLVAFSFLNCFSSDIKNNKASAVVQKMDCKDALPEKTLECSANLLRLAQQELNDPGTLLEQKILAKDTYCLSVEQTWEFGGENVKKEFRSKRTFTFPVCHYSDFFDKLEDDLIFGGIGFGLGFGVGVGVAK